MRRVSIPAILIGGIADNVLTILFELPLLFIVIYARGVTGPSAASSPRGWPNTTTCSTACSPARSP
jgi:hypothetical protein